MRSQSHFIKSKIFCAHCFYTSLLDDYTFFIVYGSILDPSTMERVWREDPYSISPCEWYVLGNTDASREFYSYCVHYTS